MQNDEQIKAVFAAFDKDGSGKLDKSEVLRALKKGGKKATAADVEKMVQAIDKNGNKQVDLDEFKQMFALLPEKQRLLGISWLFDVSVTLGKAITKAGEAVVVDAPVAAIKSGSRRLSGAAKRGGGHGSSGGGVVQASEVKPVVTSQPAPTQPAPTQPPTQPSTQPSTTPEARLTSFVHFALSKLAAAGTQFEDDTPEEDFRELCSFAEGMSRNLKAAGAGAGPELRGAIRTCLLPAWDIANDTPGEALKTSGAPALKAALEGLLAKGGPLEEAHAGHEASQVAHEAAHEAAHASDASVRPGGLSKMTLASAVAHAWDVDRPQRVEYGASGFTLDMQSKRDYNGADRCKRPLFESVNKSHRFWQSRTTKAFLALLDNYEREVGKSERQTPQEKREEAEFLDALCEAPCVRFAFEWLKVHGTDPRARQLRTKGDFQHLLFDLWLAPYRRLANNDSSGFEHVFVGEEKNGEIIGLHNWVQYYLEEQKGKINYLGWTGRQDSDYSDDVHLVTVKFSWQDDDPLVEVKPMSTFLCGSTVEFEMAALTMAFLGGNQNGDNTMRLGNESILIKCYSQRTRYGSKIGTAYIEIAK